jgi:hypothetical protein
MEFEIKRVATGEPDEDYDHALFDGIVHQLEIAGVHGASFSMFDQYQGVYLTVPGVDTFWVEDSWVEGKPVATEAKFKDAWLEDEEGNKYSATRGDYFLVPAGQVFEGNTLVLIDMQGNETRKENPVVADFPDLLDVRREITFEPGTHTDVYSFIGERSGKVAVVKAKGDKIDASDLIEICKEINNG